MSQPISFIQKLAVWTVLLFGVVSVIHAEPYQTIISNGNPANRVDIAVLGDGYTAAQLAQYQADVANFFQGVFNQEPYREYQRFYNVHRIDVTSNQSGADHPERSPQVFVDTAFDAAYNCAAIQRLICVNVAKVNQVIGTTLPASYFDVILIMVNDPEYGGSGGSVAVSSVHPSGVELILHEVGHSFGLLADEYTGGGPSCNPNVEPSQPNSTRETNRALIKWNVWIDAITPIPTLSTTPAVPGLYQGSSYCDTGLYRNTSNNKMRNLGLPFEQINTEQHVKRVYNFVSPIDASTPAGAAVNLGTGGSQLFTVTTPQPFTHALNINWLVDGLPRGTGASLDLSGSTLTVGAHTVRAVITDTTPFVRNDPGQLLIENRDWTVNVTLSKPPPFDIDGDGKTDFGVFRPSNGTWYALKSLTGTAEQLQFGQNGDVPLDGDIDGDRKADHALWRPTTGEWFYRNSSNGVFGGAQWGINGDRVVAGDYDADGKTDLAVWRPSNGLNYIVKSTGGFLGVQWGTAGDIPSHADLNNDGKTDFAVFRPSNGTWYTLVNGTATTETLQFGQNGDIPVRGDIDGDGKSDIILWRPTTGEWFFRRSSILTFGGLQWGSNGDRPVPGDYDGDARTDYAVWRSINGIHYIVRNSGGFIGVQWGGAGDVPVLGSPLP